MSEAPIDRTAKSVAAGIGWILALAIATFALLRGLEHTDDYWLNADEGIYWAIAHRDVAQANAMVATNAHPPLYYWLLRATGAFGDGVVPLRAPSAVIGALAVFAAFLLGRALHGSSAGLLGALLLALAPGMLRLSTVARPYTAQIALTLLALWMLARTLQNHQRPGRAAAGFAAFAVLALLVHYSSTVVLGATALTVGALAVTRPLTRPQTRALVLAAIPFAATAAALYLLHLRPHVIGSAMQQQARTEWLAPFFGGSFGRHLLSIHVYLAGPQWAGVSLVASAIGWLGCIGGRTTLLAVLGPVTLAAAAALSALELYPFGGTRHCAYLAALLVPTIACGIVRLLAQVPLPAVLTALALAATLVYRTEVNELFGVPPVEDPAIREVFVPFEEVEGLLPVLRKVSEQPGLLVLDACTASVLNPLLSERQPSPLRGPGFACFRLGQRIGVQAHAWSVPGGFDERREPRHLNQLLGRVAAADEQLAAAYDREVLVLTASQIPRGGSRQSGAVLIIGRFVDTVYETPEIHLFRLDAKGYAAHIATLPK